jgi:hypothetical protein
MTTDLDLPTLDRLHAEATPGDWLVYVEHCTDREQAKRECERLVDGTKGESVDFYMLTTEEAVAPGVTGCGPMSRANAEWIATIHNTFPSLSARVKELEETLRGILQEKQKQRDLMQSGAIDKAGTKAGEAYEWAKGEIEREIAWLERVLRGEK